MLVSSKLVNNAANSMLDLPAQGVAQPTARPADHGAALAPLIVIIVSIIIVMLMIMLSSLSSLLS